MPTVSVITPTYNRADVLSRAIDSVLYQTYDDFEYIIIDDASTDSTENLVSQYEDERLKYIRHEKNRRQAAARNTGIRHAQGEYLAFIDSDDQWHPMKLERQIEALQARPKDWIGIYCDRKFARTTWLKSLVSDLFPNKVGKEGDAEIQRDLLSMQGMISGGSTLVIQTKIADKVNGFDERLKRHEEVDFIYRALKHGKLAYIGEQLVTIHESGEPDAVDLEEAKNIFLTKFQDDVAKIEAQGEKVRGHHDFHLARCFFDEGDFRKGINYLRSGWPSNPRQVLRLGVAILNGASIKVKNTV